MTNNIHLGHSHWLAVAQKNLQKGLTSSSKKVRDIATRYAERNPKGYRVVKKDGKIAVLGFWMPMRDLRKPLFATHCEAPLFGEF